MNYKDTHPIPPLMISHIGALSTRLRRECDKILHEQGIRLEMDQLQVALSLYYSGEGSQQEICFRLQRDKASVNRTVGFLLKEGIVSVTQDVADKRKTLVQLTTAGNALAIQVHSILEKFDASLASELTEEEKQQFNNLMTKLIAMVTPM